jgi:hypothetical protein
MGSGARIGHDSVVMLTSTLPSRLVRAVLLATAVAVTVPWSVAAADPLAARTSTERAATGQLEKVRFLDVNLYRPYAIVRQYTSYWCVPASAQTMINVINRTTDRTYATQSRYAWHAQRLNRYTYASRGNDPRGWALLLDKFVGGEWHYADRTYGSQTAGINAIVESIARTGHPVGVVVDRGTHAWTVLGFRATQVGDDLDVHGLVISE